MQRVFYAGTHFLMADAATDALLEFAALIGAAAKSQRIDLPIVTEDGLQRTMRAIIGPASQVAATDAPVAFADPDTSAFVRDLALRSRRYVESTAVVSSPDDAPWDELE